MGNYITKKELVDCIEKYRKTGELDWLIINAIDKMVLANLARYKNLVLDKDECTQECLMLFLQKQHKLKLDLTSMCFNMCNKLFREYNRQSMIKERLEIQLLKKERDE